MSDDNLPGWQRLGRILWCVVSLIRASNLVYRAFKLDQNLLDIVQRGSLRWLGVAVAAGEVGEAIMNWIEFRLQMTMGLLLSQYPRS